MCGGLVILAPGSPFQILAAILIMLLHLLVVLKLAPFIKDSEDWSSFISTLGLCLTSLGAYSMLLNTNADELNTIGVVLVGITVLCITSVFAIMIFIDCGLWNCLFKNKNSEIITEDDEEEEEKVEENNASRTQILPVSNETEVPIQSSQSLTRTRSVTEDIVNNIHQEHRKSQLQLDATIEMNARKQRRKTQLRLKTRTKLKKQKTLSKIPAFKALNETEIEAMIDVMTRESHLMGDVLCQQGDVADKFYVVMSGRCNAYVQKKKGGNRKVGTISMYNFFGESSLLSKPGVKDVRNATVEVDSDSSTLLVLTKSKFYELIETGKLKKEVLEGVKKIDEERQTQNLDGGGGDGGSGGLVGDMDSLV